jgi:cell pole-organizing protein PopZ
MSSSQVAWKTLTRPATRHEPSLEELLASIIRSIGEDEAANESSLGPKPPAQSLAAPPALRAVPMQPKPAVLAVDAACSTLPDIGQPNGSARSVEDLISELRPMLKTWLKDNLPALVERLVRGEIERISRHHVPRRADANC